ncbi:hypothetical protein D3C72_1412870 [compost metagenome]
MLQQTVEDVREHFVRTVAEENLIALHTVILGDGGFQQVAVRVRVQTQVVIQFGLHRCQGFWRRAVRVFIGVELDQFGQLRLFARHVGHQILDERAPEFTHRSVPLPF